MSYADLARSHVKECAREAFGLTELVVDCDGDLPFSHGTANYYVSVRSDGRKVKAWSHAVLGVRSSAAVLREVNALNARLEHARAFLVEERLLVEGVLPVDGLTPEDLRELCLEVGTTADEFGQLVSTVHGGVTARSADDEGCDHCGS
jgi:hypothetical protein